MEFTCYFPNLTTTPKTAKNIPAASKGKPNVDTLCKNDGNNHFDAIVRNILWLFEFDIILNLNFEIENGQAADCWS